jgi:hypothetical protein
LPSINKLFLDKKDKGLHVFAVYVQGHTREEVEKFISDRGFKLPVPHGGAGFSAYREGWSGIPYAFVIGPDGKVAWEGRDGYAAVVERELARIKYPGLGKLEVAPGLERAATLFSGGEYARARDEATRLKERRADDEAFVADADFIIQRVEETATMLQERIETGKAGKRYHEVMRDLDALSKGFRGTEIGDKAAEEIRTLRRDRDVRRELTAWEDLEKVITANEKLTDNAAKRRNLVNFYNRNEGTAAAAEARKLAGGGEE